MPFYKRSALFFQVIFILGPLILQVLSIELSDKTNLVGKQVKKNSNLRGAANGEVKEYLSGESIARTRREEDNSGCGSGESGISITSINPPIKNLILESVDGETISSSSEINGATYCVPQDKCFLLTIEGWNSRPRVMVTVDGESTRYFSLGRVMVRNIGSCECEAGTKKVEIGIRSDRRGIDNHFIVKKRNDRNNWRGDSFSMNGFPNWADILVSKCLPKNKCYKFFLFDEVNEDGISRFEPFDVIWDGEYVVEGGTFEDGRRTVSPKFGKC